MAVADSTQRDQSRFQLKSYKWREIDINDDWAIRLLEQAYQASLAINGITAILRSGINNGDPDADAFNAYQVDSLLAGVENLAENLLGNICLYANHIDERVEAKSNGGTNS